MIELLKKAPLALEMSSKSQGKLLAGLNHTLGMTPPRQQLTARGGVCHMSLNPHSQPASLPSVLGNEFLWQICTL